MNLRILKKLSKRAMPLLGALCSAHGLTEFVVADGDGYTGTAGHDRKHMERYRARSVDGWHQKSDVLVPRRAGGEFQFVGLSQPGTPWDGTPGVGWMSGYEEREWEERTAWEYLEDHVYNVCTDFLADGEDDDGWPRHKMVVLRKLPNPAAVLRAARELIAAAPAPKGDMHG